MLSLPLSSPCAPTQPTCPSRRSRARSAVLLWCGVWTTVAVTTPALAQPKAGPPNRKAAAATTSETPMESFTLAQATAGLKGSGPLVATIELEQKQKPLSTLRCELTSDLTPNTVAHFVGLARGLRPFVAPESRDPKRWVRRPLYDGTWIHRVLPDYLIQGGDPSCAVFSDCGGLHGMGDAGFSIPDEIRPELRFDRPGRLALANKGPNTGSSQFFITERPAPWLNNTATIFGQCEPAEAIRSIARLPARVTSVPMDPVIIKRVTVGYGEASGPSQGAGQAAGKAVNNPVRKP